MGWTFYNSNGEALVQHAESEATKAEMEAETAVAHFVPPDLVKNSPGVAKAWVSIDADGTLASPDYNIASITDTGTGDRDINFTTAMSGAVFAVGGTSLGDAVFFRNTGRTTADFRIEVMNSGNTGTADVASTHLVLGDQ